MKKIILIGAGGHAKSCIDVIEQTSEFRIEGLIDLKEKIGQKILGYPIIDCDENITKYIENDRYFLITIGQIKSADKRKNIYENLKKTGANLATVISPSAYVSKYAHIKQGTIIMHKAFINAGVQVGENCIINTNAHLEHDVTIGNHCHISTSSVINGDVKIGNEVFIGSNSTVVNGVEIKDNSFIRAGSLVK